MFRATLSNTHCVLELRDRDGSDVSIHGEDITDTNNIPVFYTQSKRGIRRAWHELLKTFDEKMTMYAAARFLNDHGQKTHTYCAMD